MRVLTRAVLGLACLLFIPAAAYAQGTIAGTVKDASGNSTTYTATGSAVASLAKLSAGDEVTVTHTDTSATKIVKAAAKKSGKSSK